MERDFRVYKKHEIGDKMNITKVIGVIYEQNTYILEKDGDCIIIDAGAKPEDIRKLCEGKNVLAVFLTHGHYDHSIFYEEYTKLFDCKIYANKNVVKTMTDAVALYSENGKVFNDFSNFVFLDDYEKLKIGSFCVECFYCPGHSICSQCFLIDKNLFAGDVLFSQGIGRTDLKFGSKEDMFNSLCKLEALDYENVFSGHGEESDKNEQRKNISLFKRFLSR